MSRFFGNPKVYRIPLLALTAVALQVPTAVAGTYGKVNVALNKPVTALTNSVAGTPAYVNDGRFSTTWYSYQGGMYNQCGFQVDLGSTISVGKLHLHPQQVFGIRIRSSVDGQNWTLRHSYDWSTSLWYPMMLAVDGAYSARYLKFEAYASYDQYVGIDDFQVFEWLPLASPPPPSAYGTENLALGKPIDDFSTSNPSTPPAQVNDGSPATAWSGAFNYHIGVVNTTYTSGLTRIDLGREYQVGKVVLGSGAAQGYRIYFTKDDAVVSTVVWKWPASRDELYSVSAPDSFGRTMPNLQSSIYVDGAVKARYIWVQPFAASQGSQVEPNLSEIEVFEWKLATPSSGTYGRANLALGKPVTAQTNTILGTLANVNDGRFDTLWYSYQGGMYNQCIFQLDLGSEVSVGQMRVWPEQVWGMTIRTSTDGVNWTARAVYDSPYNWPTSLWYPLTIEADGSYSARYIRFEAYARYDQYVGIRDLQLYAWLPNTLRPPASAYGIENLALAKPVESFGTSDPATPATYVNDGNLGTAWNGAFRYSPLNVPYISGLTRVDLGREYSIGKVDVALGTAQGYLVYFTRDDGVIHTPVWKYPASQNEVLWKTFPGAFGLGYAAQSDTSYVDGEISARYVWILPFAAGGSVIPSVREIRVYEWQPQPAPQPGTARLVTSAGTGVPGGEVSYQDAAGNWQALGITGADGTLQFSLPAGTWTFRMRYLGRSVTKVQDIASPVQFTTTRVTLQFTGSVEYRDDGGVFRAFSKPAMELLTAGEYLFRFGLSGTAALSLTGAPITKSAVAFLLLDSAGVPLAGGTSQYYLSGWRTAGITGADGWSLALLDGLVGSLNFGMNYATTRQEKTQNLASDSILVFRTSSIVVQLRDSAGNLLDSGTATYYTNGWYSFGSTSGGQARKELFPGNYRFKMSYATTTQEKVQDVAADPVVAFQTSNITVRLRDSAGNPMDTGTATYYTNGWYSFGSTSSGEVRKELFPGSYRFAMNYGTTRFETLQDVAANPLVVFQTSSVTIQLRDSAGNPLDTGTATYYTNGWYTFGSTIGGQVRKEMFPGTYRFKMTYATTSQEKQQDISANPVVVFQTSSITIRLIDSAGNPLDTGSASYYTNGWYAFGSTVGGQARKEMFPGSYSFRMTYAATSQDRQQDVAANPVVVFQTGGVFSATNTAQAYYTSGWYPFVQNMQLMPGNYSFRFTDGTPNTSYPVVAGTVNSIH